MNAKYQIVVAKDIKELLKRMAKYDVSELGGLIDDRGVFTQSFLGVLSKDALEAQVKAREDAVENEKALKLKYAAKRKEQAEQKKASNVSPVGKNFKKGSPIDRDFQDQVKAGKIDSMGNTISPRAQLTAEKKKNAADKKATAKLNPKKKAVTKGEGFTVVEGEIPADMK